MKEIRPLIVAIAVFLAIILAISNYQANLADKIISDAETVAVDKDHEEAIARQIESKEKTVTRIRFLGNVTAFLTILIGVLTAYAAIRRFSLEREAERLDRMATECGYALANIASDSARQRAAVVATLQSLIAESSRTATHSSRHLGIQLRIASLLALVGRTESDLLVRSIYGPVLQNAFDDLSRDMLRSISWRGLSVSNISLVRKNKDLRGFDFRDARLECVSFESADLTGSTFGGAELKGCNLSGTTTERVDFGFVDLAGARLCRAQIGIPTDFRGVRVFDADVYEADFRQCSEERLLAIDWTLTRAWRQAKFPTKVEDSLKRRYGGNRRAAPRILMLCWEAPPFVMGGVWSAVFHLVRAECRLGVEITMVSPWGPSFEALRTLGNEVRWEFCSAISGGTRYYSPWDETRPSAEEASQTSLLKGHSLVRQAEAFSESILREAERLKGYDVIHAHDWLTFLAAKQLAEALHIPWIAHYHSIETQRRGSHISDKISSIEYDALAHADAVVVASKNTQCALDQLAEGHLKKITPSGPTTIDDNSTSDDNANVEDGKLAIVSNFVTELDKADMSQGDFYTRRVVFLGRLEEQKGPDVFVQIAAGIKKRMHGKRLDFTIFGSGSMRQKLAAMIDEMAPQDPLVVNDDKPGSWRLCAEDIEDGAAFYRRELEDGTMSAMTRPTCLENVQKVVSTSTCEALPFQADDRFTHLVYGRNEDGAISFEFLIRTRKLPSYKEADGRFVVLNGPLPWSNRQEAFDGASLVVVSSRDEPFGMVILEAMQHGVPVVYPRSAGVVEALEQAIASGSAKDTADRDRNDELNKELCAVAWRNSAIEFEDIEEAASVCSSILENEVLWYDLVSCQRRLAARVGTAAPEALLRVWEACYQGHCKKPKISA